MPPERGRRPFRGNPSRSTFTPGGTGSPAAGSIAGASAGGGTHAKHPTRYVGDLRRSAAASTFGPGAIADFRTPEGAPVSVVMPCAEEWQHWPTLDTVHDPRLERLLDVTGFRLTPVPRNPEEAAKYALAGVRFPKWLQCPGCHTLQHYKRWAQQDGAAARFCPACSGGAKPKDRTYAVPVRFVLACDAGHLSDFRWDTWLTHKPDCTAGASGLRLRSIGAGLAGIRLFCSECEENRSIDEAFNPAVTEHWKCSGEHPWAGTRDAGCDRPVKVVQRGASNLYFTLVHSSLLIPPWDCDYELRLGDRWPDLLDAENREKQLRRWIENGSVLAPPDQSLDHFVESVVAYAESRDAQDISDFRRAEWDSVRLTTGRGTTEFEVRQERVPDALDGMLQDVIRVVRLRELRALTGFTRIVPPPSAEDTGEARRCDVFRTPDPKWYPAVEVRGEGIFVSLNPEKLAVWEVRPEVEERRTRIWNAWCAEYEERYGEDAHPEQPLTSRFLLVHALSHALIRELSLECGYSTASLRERLYAGDYGAGVLIYTATADADGTLGGLERQGLEERIGVTIRNAVRALQWCSSDPLCITGAMMASNACNLAACHACMLAPETSCEQFNRFLDRALLIGTPEDPGTGFFRALLEEA